MDDSKVGDTESVKSRLSVMVASSAMQRAREVERLSAVTLSGARTAVLSTRGMGDTPTPPWSDLDFGSEDLAVREWLNVHAEGVPLLTALGRIESVLNGPVLAESGDMSREQALGLLVQSMRAAKGVRDDLAEELTALREDARHAAAGTAAQELDQQRKRRAELADSLAHAQDCNRRRGELLQRLTALKQSVGSSSPTAELTQHLENFKRSLESLSAAKDGLLIQESMMPLGRGPDWLAALEGAKLPPTIDLLGELVVSLTKLGASAEELQAELTKLAGEPLGESHLEDLAQQLASQPAAGLEALEQVEEADTPAEGAGLSEDDLRQRLEGLNVLMALALGLGVLAGAGGLVLLLGDQSVFGMVLLAVGPPAGGIWGWLIHQRRSSVRRQISELVRRRVAEHSRAPASVNTPDERPERGDHLKLPAVAERVRGLQAARKATAKGRLQVRSEHATWTKNVLKLEEFARKRLPAIPDPFDGAAVADWIRVARECMELLEAEVVRQERSTLLRQAKAGRESALSLFGVSRSALTGALGGDAEALSHEELESRARVLLGDCIQIQALESALAMAVEIPPSPLQERLSAVDSRIAELERQDTGSAWEVDLQQAPPEVRTRIEDMQASYEAANGRYLAQKEAHDSYVSRVQNLELASNGLKKAIVGQAQEFRDRVRTVFSRLVARFWSGLGQSMESLSRPGLNDKLLADQAVADHVAASVELLRQTAMAASGPGRVRLIISEPLADADNPTYLAWLEALMSEDEDAPISGVTILTCQPWRVDALRSLRPDMFLSIPVRTVDE